MVEVSGEVWESVARWLELAGLRKPCGAYGSPGPSAGPSPRGTRGTSPRRWRGSAQRASSGRPSLATRGTSTWGRGPAASSRCSATASRSWPAAMLPWGSSGAEPELPPVRY